MIKMHTDIVDANWTAEHQRRLAKKDLMLVQGIITGTTKQNLDATYQVPIPTQSTVSDPKTVAEGHCYCGKVKLELPLDINPAISVICHCHDCREWHSVGSLPYMMFPLERVEDNESITFKVPIKLLSSPSELGYVHRTPEVRRYYATCCGTRLFNTVFNEKLGLKLCGTFPTVFPTYEWVPTMHVNVREGNTLNYPPLQQLRWSNLPSEFGELEKRFEHMKNWKIGNIYQIH